MPTPTSGYSLIEEILSRPNLNAYVIVPSFHSRTLKNNWESAMGSNNYYNRNDPFKGEIFTYFWRILRYLNGKNPEFKKFTEHWIRICQDHSTQLLPVEQHHRLYVNLPSPGYGIPAPTSAEAQNPLKGCTRLYYIASGINNIPTTPSDQEPAGTPTTHTYKAEDSHSLQKTLIKLRGGESITTKIYKDTNTQSRIIYFNKYDTLAIAYLQMYALTQSWAGYSSSITDKFTVKITNIMNALIAILKNSITETTWNSPVKDALYFAELYAALKGFEDELTKLDVNAGLLEDFATSWQKRLFTTEQESANRVIEQSNASANVAMDSYYKLMETIREKQKFLLSLTMNEADTQFLTKYFNMFKTLPGTIFHKEGNKLYCLYDVPFSNSDFAALKKQINYIPEDLAPKNEVDWNGSIFAENLFWAIRYGSSANNGYWSAPLITGFKDKEYWKAFVKSYKRLLTEIFVDRTTALFLSTCLQWNMESNDYQPNGTTINSLPHPFQPFIRERMWQPHITHYNCWQNARSEITKALSKRDPETAFEYTISASGQISFPETAGSKIAGYLVGNNKGYFSDNVKDAAEKLRVYQRLGQPQRETLREVLSIYVKEELGEKIPEPIVIPKVELPKKSIQDRLVWLEQKRFTIPAGTNITSVPSETDTRFIIDGNSYIFLPSGDFLTLENYEKFTALFPDAPKSIPSNATETTRIPAAAEEPRPRPRRAVDDNTPTQATAADWIIPITATWEAAHIVTRDHDQLYDILPFLREVANSPNMLNIASSTDTQQHAVFHFKTETIYFTVDEVNTHLLPQFLINAINSYRRGGTLTGDDFNIDEYAIALPSGPEPSIRIVSTNGHYFIRTTNETGTRYQHFENPREPLNFSINAFSVPLTELHLARINDTPIVTEETIRNAITETPETQHWRNQIENARIQAIEVMRANNEQRTNTAEPAPVPPLRYIRLDYDITQGWRFPRAALLPEEFQDFSLFVPDFGIRPRPVTPPTPGTHIVQYDILEDIVFYQTTGERLILSTSITEQVRGAF